MLKGGGAQEDPASHLLLLLAFVTAHLLPTFVAEDQYFDSDPTELQNFYWFF